MRDRHRFVIFLSVVALGGCSNLQYGGSRVVLLVLVPAAIVVVGLYLLRRRHSGRGGGRGPRYPDYDDRD